jgi:hypothetical protein
LLRYALSAERRVNNSTPLSDYVDGTFYAASEAEREK